MSITTDTTDTIDEVTAEQLVAGDLVWIPGYDRRATVASVESHTSDVEDDDTVLIRFTEIDGLDPMIVIATAPWHVVKRVDVGMSDDEVAALDAKSKRAAEVEAYTDDLRAVADWFDAHPDIVPTGGYGGADLILWTQADELPALVRAFGAGDKVATDYAIGITRRFGRHTVGVKAARDAVCTKVETGETKVETKTSDATDPVPEGATNVRTVTRTEVIYEIETPVTEWSCPPALLSMGGDQAEG